LKIAFNLSPRLGPYGGGNTFLHSISQGLRRRGHEVYHDLTRNDLDVVFILDPRWNHGMISFNSRDLVFYLLRNKQALVVHRINECDERKGTSGMNRKLRRINYLADQTVIVGSWLRDLDLFAIDRNKSFNSNEIQTILNGSDSELFYPANSNFWKSDKPLKIITHHWSAHPNKGRDVYLFLDKLLEESKWRRRIEFTFVGNVLRPEEFRNTRFISALEGPNLAEELRKHHCYLTASKYEPGSNHQNDGGLSGLPILYLNSGCLPEYCEGFGIGFDSSEDLPDVIESLMLNYDLLQGKMRDFPHNHLVMVENYIKLLEELLAVRDSKLKIRNLFRNRLTLLRLLFPM
jgi:hypothetical protein